MVPKIMWVMLPLGLYAGYAAVTAIRRRVPVRQVFNAHTSLLLMLYLLATAGLGVFWVARQQLPVFDLHYLFGYATLLLVAIHLVLNLPLAWRHLTRRIRPMARAGPRATAARRSLTSWLAIGAALVGAFVLGARHGRGKLTLTWAAEGTADAKVLGPVKAIVEYHEYSSQSRSDVFARAPSVDWGPALAVFKSYPELPQVSLPEPEAAAVGGRSLSRALAGPAAGPASPDRDRGALSRKAISTILYHSAGVVRMPDGTVERPAPSSGALFPAELYLAARQVDGLPPGLYHYAPEHHRLERLARRLPSAAALGAPHQARALERAPAALLLTARFQRTGHKYSDRAYRYATLDVGHLITNLQVASAEIGSAARLLDRFDEEASAAALGIDGIQEGVIAFAILEPAETATAQPLPARFHYPGPPIGPDKLIGVTGMVHRATSLRALRPPAQTPATKTGAPRPATLLPEPRPAPGSALHTIIERRSKRRFTDEALSLQELGSLLADAAGPPQLSPAIQIYLVVNRVAGLAPGIYRYLTDQYGLERLRAGEFGQQAYSLGLSQDVVGDAAVVVVLAAERNAILSHEGARGYRHALLEAGVIGERIMLSVVARGLGGCPVGAFYDDEAGQLIDPKRKQLWVLHLAAIGQVDP